MIYVIKEPPGPPLPKKTFLRDFVTFHILLSTYGK